MRISRSIYSPGDLHSTDAKDVKKECDFMRYEMRHMFTGSGIGWFACMPCEEMEFESGLEYLREHPFDDFMHKYMLQQAATFGPNLVNRLIDRGKEGDPYLLALMYELCIIHDRLKHLRERFDDVDIKGLSRYSPLIYIRWYLEKRDYESYYWISLFSENTSIHKTLPHPDVAEQNVPFDEDTLRRWRQGIVTVRDVTDHLDRKIFQAGQAVQLTPGETAARAMSCLSALNLFAGQQITAKTTLAPCAIQIPWHLNVAVSTGRNKWRLSGIQRSYGQGLEIDEARASCLMEIVERYSAFAGFDSDGAVGYAKSYPLIKGRYEDLRKKGYNVLDPNEMCLEVTYSGQELYWISAERVGKNGSRSIYVPVQLVFLFSNLDELSLTSGLPSTGLAAANSIEEARLRSLLEVLERDAERVLPFVWERCFLLDAEDIQIKGILEDCVKNGIQVIFLDITSEFGVPCYKAFVQGPDGRILKGCGANLDGKKAAVSALLEVPCPFPGRLGSMPAPKHLKTVRYEELPDYSTGDIGGDLRLLETLLIANGYHPIYIDLTRKDLGIPVVKTLIPGLEIMNDFDRFSRLSMRQFGHYLKECA